MAVFLTTFLAIFSTFLVLLTAKHVIKESTESPCSTPPAIQFGYLNIDEKEPISDIMDTNSSTIDQIVTMKEGMILFPDQRNAYPSGTTVGYGCDEGYRLKPPNYTNICSNGRWLGKSPYCVSSGCPMPSPIINGYFLEHSEFKDGLFKPGSSRQFLCHSGYFIKGPDTFTCEESGKWTPEETVECLPTPAIKNKKKCAIPPDVWGANKKLLQGMVNENGALHQTVVEYSCLPGYRNVLSPCDPHTLTCRQGDWYGTSPQCEKSVSCLAPKSIENGFVYEVLSIYPIHSQVYYGCKPGYSLVGSSVLTCQDTGCWVPSRPPSCEPSKPVTDHSDDAADSLLPQIEWAFIIILFLLVVLFIAMVAFTYGTMRSPHKWFRSLPPPNSNERQAPRTIRPPPAPPVYDPDRVALIPLPHESRRPNPPSYEEATRPRPMLTVDHQTRHTPHTHRSRAHRVVGGGRRSRHRDHLDNISYQSIGSARQSSGTSRSMSMRSSSACDSLGSTDTMAISDSTNVTVETMSSGAASGASQTISCRGLAGSRASVDTSSLITNEGAPLLEEAEGEDSRPPDSFSFSTRDSDSFKDNVSHTRSITTSLQET